MAEVFDTAVIGGGIVGMASALALVKGGRLPLVVLEAETELATHQTGRNSGVIHSGIYYKPGSLKAGLCAAGREEMFRFCAERGVAHERCGKVIVATSESELPALAELERRGRANGLKAVRRIGPEQVREREPHVSCVGGLLVEETGIVDFKAATRAMAAVVQDERGLVWTGRRVVGVRRERDGFVIETAAGVVRARNLVNCAGLHSDRVAGMCGVDPGVRIIPFRGEYYDLIPSRAGLCRHLIYPVPDARFPFLGVHFTRGVDGVVEAGPNAVLALARHGYSWRCLSGGDCAGMLGYGGFWRMAARHWRTGVMEVRRSLSRRLFLRAMRRLIPEVGWNDVTPGRAGVRAQAVAPDGSLIDDFRLVDGEGAVHVLNAPSPAATASLSIGRTIAERAGMRFRERVVAAGAGR